MSVASIKLQNINHSLASIRNAVQVHAPKSLATRRSNGGLIKYQVIKLGRLGSVSGLFN